MNFVNQRVYKFYHHIIFMTDKVMLRSLTSIVSNAISDIRGVGDFSKDNVPVSLGAKKRCVAEQMVSQLSAKYFENEIDRKSSIW